MLMVSGRDFLVDTIFNKTTEGKYLHAWSSNHDKDHLVPEKSGITRGSVLIGGWILEPSPTQPDTTNATFLTEIDFRGYMPDMLAWTALNYAGY